MVSVRRKAALAAGFLALVVVAVLADVTIAGMARRDNLIDDSSFEITKERDQFGLVFAKWSGWNYEGDCTFGVGRVAHSGKTSALLSGTYQPKIRIRQSHTLTPGRYRTTAFIRGLDIGTGVWNATTEFMFDGQYIQLKKNGTFGWTKLTYVADVKEKKEVTLSFGLFAPGYFWIDDVTLSKVGNDVALTPVPVLSREQAPIAAPGRVDAHAVRCPECGYRNMPAWKRCYACGTPLGERKSTVAGPPRKLLTSFEGDNPFDGATTVGEHATDGKAALRIARSYASMSGQQDWSGYDYLKADLYAQARDPLPVEVEIHDTGTSGYWTRVNYNTVVPPGASTLVLPIKQLYVGEKSRAGRALVLKAITRFVLGVGDKPAGPLFVDAVRLERDESAIKVQFEGLYAFDFGTGSSPLMEGFTRITPATAYSAGRGYGLKNAKVWRSFDGLQPDPLYQDFICIEAGGLAVDVPNGRYRVFVNIDSPSGYWGEYQVYRQRAVLAQGRQVVAETMNFEQLKEKYFRFWNTEDLPTDNTFDKYQKAYFQEKAFEVDVTNGRLELEFQGEAWASSVSAVVVYPVAKAAEGERFLRWVEDKRRFYFDNAFKRVIHRATGDAVRASPEEERRGYLAFAPDFMRDVFSNDTPLRSEIGRPLSGEVSAGEYASVTVGLLPRRDLGKVTVNVGDLTAPGGSVIRAAATEVGYVSHRIKRVTDDGAVYTIAPRLIMPSNSTVVSKGVARSYWLLVRTPRGTPPGKYTGKVTITPEHGAASSVPLELVVHKGALDAVDIPVGPWGFSIVTPWSGDDPASKAFNETLSLMSLEKLREYGFTTFSGQPNVRYLGFKDGKPELDFASADPVMRRAKELGFLAVVSYGSGVHGFNPYYQDTGAMTAAGFKDYSAFVRAVYSAVQRHADSQGWLPVYWNIGDEPGEDDLTRSRENAAAYGRAFAKGPPFFTAATSFVGRNKDDPRFLLSKELDVANWNGHDEQSVNLLRRAGGHWAFYNGGNRWTFGDYLYKAVKQFGAKFRLSWHWNIVAGDPYYALDCREDDYAWCNATPGGKLVRSVEFERFRAGLDDYRRLLTLSRLAKQKAGTPAGKAGEALIRKRLSAFRLGQRDHDAIFPRDDRNTFRRQVANAIDALR